MKDDRLILDYERPDWPPEREPARPPFTCHRMDLPPVKGPRSLTKRPNRRAELATDLCIFAVGMISGAFMAAIAIGWPS